MPVSTIYRIKRNGDWVFIADDVESCELVNEKYLVKFKSRSNIFHYNRNNIQLFSYAKTYSAPFVGAQFVQSNRVIDNVRKIEEYEYKLGDKVVRKCWRVNDGQIYSSEIQVQSSCDNQQSKDVFSYLSDVANYSELQAEDGTTLLPLQYNRITSIMHDSPLSIYLGEGDNHEITPSSLLIFPFGCNRSQYTAVKNALTNKVSIIQGPPGTGKTQTILNIIANLLLAGKNVQVVSNNNVAVENIYDKLHAFQLDFLAAQLGKLENQEQFFKITQTGQYPNISSWKISGGGAVSHLDKLIRDYTQISLLVFKCQEKAAVLKEELHQLTIEQQHFEQYMTAQGIVLSSQSFDDDKSSKSILQHIHRIERRIEWRERWWIVDEIFSFVMRILHHEEQDNIKLHSLKRLFYIRKKDEIEKDLKRLTDYISKYAPSIEKLQEVSLQRLKGILYNKYGARHTRTIYNKDAIKNNTGNFLNDYPVVLSTTFSALNNIPTAYRFDYVIMDEASQVDIATGALSLYSANNAVIVGDDKQLPNVVTDSQKEILNTVFSQYQIPSYYNSAYYSFLQSVASLPAKIPSVLLREHYRCHPLIIGFCNKRFYDNRLLIMSDYQDDQHAINVLRTVAGNHARGHVNQRQVDAIVSEIIPTLPYKCDDIGIIAPYNLQIDALQKALEDNGCQSIQASTVHKFQGREKDVIILSTVDNEINSFVDDPNLMNVAISRAKKQLYVLVSQTQLPTGVLKDLVAYIEYNQGNIIDSQIYSVFDILYSQYTDERTLWLQTNNKDSKEYISETRFDELLNAILSKYSLHTLKIYKNYPLRNLIKQTAILTDEERKYLYRSGTHVDFLLSDVVTSKPIVAMEVDGCSYHSKGSKQYKRDLLKDSIFSKCPDIAFHRFPTNGSGEKEIILSLLKQRGYLPQDKSL
jgi:RecA/RadA recombinase